MKLKTLLFSVLIISNSNCFSQEEFSLKEFVKEKNKLQGTIENGYVINKNNERKAGYVILGTDSRNSEFIYFQKYKNAPPEKLTKKEISEYGFDNTIYELIPSENDSVFMLRLNTKEPYLYYFKGKSKKEFYIKEGDNYSLLPESKQELIVELKKSFNNCETVLDQMEKAIPNKNRLSNLLTYYNECSNKKLSYFKYGAFAGITMGNIDFYDNSIQSYTLNGPLVNLTDFTFESSITYDVGFYLEAPFLESKFNWTFHPEIEFLKTNYNFKGNVSLLNEIDYPTLTNGKIQLDIYSFNLNLFLRYNTLRKYTSIFLDLGPVISYNIPTAKINTTELDFDLNNFMMGLGGNLGIDAPLFSKFNYNTGIKANYLFPAGGDEKTKFSTWNVGIYFAFGF